MTKPPKILSKRQAAAYLGVCERTIDRAVERGRLTRVFIGPRLCGYWESDVVAFPTLTRERLPTGSKDAAA
jgi:excisionase family DNA binding protein